LRIKLFGEAIGEVISIFAPIEGSQVVGAEVNDGNAVGYLCSGRRTPYSQRRSSFRSKPVRPHSAPRQGSSQSSSQAGSTPTTWRLEWRSFVGS
jgi:hypothetical protein